MEEVRITVGSLAFVARWEEASAPKTCAAFRARLTFAGTLLQARWSGEAAWVPLGDADLGVGYENATSYPAPGTLLFHPAGISECEILVPYGATRFAGKAGQLAGNPFLTIVSGTGCLAELGRRAIWEGAQEIRIATAKGDRRARR